MFLWSSGNLNVPKSGIMLLDTFSISRGGEVQSYADYCTSRDFSGTEDK